MNPIPPEDFNRNETDAIRAVCGGDLPATYPAMFLRYAVAVMPAMADEIDRLRSQVKGG